MFLFNEVKKNHYETLGIAKNAEGAEIKRAYFGMIRKYQPDHFPEEFKEIRAAYEILSDKEKRAEYDAIGDLPPSAAILFHEAQRLDRFGRHDKAAQFYQKILRKYSHLDNVREQYALSLTQDNKAGKAGEVWKELCRRHPETSRYARELGQCYLDRGWHKKALEETRRALDLDRSSIDNWLLFLDCAFKIKKNEPSVIDELNVLSVQALEAVKTVKVDEWKKILLNCYAIVSAGIDNIDAARGHLREIIRLIRGGGRQGQEEGLQALQEILSVVPAEGLSFLYPELREMADLLPGLTDGFFLEKLDTVRLHCDIKSLAKKKFSEIFCDLFWLLTGELEDDEDILEVIAIECILLEDKSAYDPQIRRLREEFPELYALHASFFNEALRTRDPDKMVYLRSRKYNKLKREAGIYDEDTESAPLEPVYRTQPKVGRNDPCPCGSGKKYKRCCGA
ncbi:MAG: DnaJ domain-containing protein [Treponema sp.]|nr:DnaJ domain-containing protein [Treponema sp.]